MSPPVTTQAIALPTGESVFYRSAGPTNADAPTILLLHGFPSSSHQYRNLIPLLASKHRVIAPDLPGFGFTTVPENYKYTFANLTTTISSFLDVLLNSPKKYSIYIFDYGAPVGLRLALSKPGAVTALVSQNGNAYVEGLTPFWDPIKAYWASSGQEDRDKLRAFFTLETTKFQYEDGTPAEKIPHIAPETYTLDHALLSRPGNAEIQLDLFKDYENNVNIYPNFHQYFRESGVPILAIWGKNDQLFGYPGAEAYKRDAKDVVVKLLDAGHFAVETETETIAEAMLSFLSERGL